MKTTHKIIEEYFELVTHLKINLSYLGGFRTNGKKSHILNDIIRLHQETYQILNGRKLDKDPNQDTSQIEKEIFNKNLHQPTYGIFRSICRRVKGPLSQADANLFSNALVYGKKNDCSVSIVTCDTDIANIAYNYGINHWLSNNGQNISLSKVTIYFPCVENWTDGLNLILMSDTYGNSIRSN